MLLAVYELKACDNKASLNEQPTHPVLYYSTRASTLVEPFSSSQSSFLACFSTIVEILACFSTIVENFGWCQRFLHHTHYIILDHFMKISTMNIATHRCWCGTCAKFETLPNNGFGKRMHCQLQMLLEQQMRTCPYK